MSSQHKIVAPETAKEQIKQWHLEGLKVVFTNGCFDLLHLGHVDYLEKARAIGDKLVIGLNTDDSVRRIKGLTRPIQDQLARSRVLAALEFVDLVVFFDSETPMGLIEALTPDILVKGKDYQVSNIVGSEFVLKNGGKVETIELVSGYSTSGIIDKIKSE
jgi:rfaE bifunctional protein nucleotidyltransferase chain/domain